MVLAILCAPALACARQSSATLNNNGSFSAWVDAWAMVGDLDTDPAEETRLASLDVGLESAVGGPSCRSLSAGLFFVEGVWNVWRGGCDCWGIMARAGWGGGCDAGGGAGATYDG